MINKWALACGDCSDECLTSISKIVFRYSTMWRGLRQHVVHASHPSGRQKWRRWRRHTGTQHQPAGHASPSTRQPVFFSINSSCFVSINLTRSIQGREKWWDTLSSSRRFVFVMLKHIKQKGENIVTPIWMGKTWNEERNLASIYNHYIFTSLMVVL